MATLYVGTSEGYYATINEAISAASNGDTIIVKGSEYTLTNEKVTITKALTIQAEGDVTVDSFGVGANVAEEHSIVIDGFNFKPTANTTYTSNTSGIYEAGTSLHNLTVTNCSFDLSGITTNYGYGIYCSLNEPGIAEAVITGCTFVGEGNASTTEAVYLAHITSVTCNDNVIRDISGHSIHISPTGVYSSSNNGEAEIIISGNDVSNVGGMAIYLQGFNNPNTIVEVTDNDFTNIQLNGAHEYGAVIRIGSPTLGDLTITGNNINGANAGVYQNVIINEGSEGAIDISDNSFILNDGVSYASGEELAASVVNSYDAATGTVNSVLPDNNEFIKGSDVPGVSDTTTLFVDSSFAGLDDGAYFGVGEDKGYIIGTNAFGSFASALQNIAADTTGIKVNGSVTEDGPAAAFTVNLDKNFTISGGKVTWNNAGGWGKKVTFSGDEGVTLTFDDITFDGGGSNKAAFVFNVDTVLESGAVFDMYNGYVNFDKTIEVSEGAQFNVIGEAFHVYGKLNVAGKDDFAASTAEASDRQVFMKYSNNMYGEVNIENTYVVNEQYWGIRPYDGSAAAFTVSNSLVELGKNFAGNWVSNPFSSGENFIGLENGKFTLENKSILKVSGASVSDRSWGKYGYGLSVSENSEFKVLTGSYAEFGTGVYNAGTITVSDSELQVGTNFVAFGGSSIPNFDFQNLGTVNVENSTIVAKDALTNEGTINVSGSSKLSFGSISGSGVIDIAAGTTLTDTVITAGNIKRNAGTVYFNGANQLTGTFSNNPADWDIVINKGASLLIARSSYVLGYDRDITVYGLINDATSLTADDLANTVLSLKADSTSGFSVGGTGTNVVTVQDAYVDLANTSWKNSSAKHTWSFTNSYVKANSFGNCNAPAGNSASWDVTFDDSVLASNYIKTAKGVTYSFTEGSVGSAGSMRIDGTLNIDATSSVTITSYQNNKKGALDEHGDISGTVNVSGTLNLNAAGNLGVELYGATFNVENGTANLNKNDVILDADSTLKVSGKGALNTTGNIVNAGKVEITVSSVEEADRIAANDITGDGTVVINAEGFKGYDKIIDLNASSLEGKVTVNGANAVYGDDGDVYITDATTDTIFVNAAWNGMKTGETTSEGYIYGYNAVSTMSEVAGKIATDGKDTTIKFLGDISSEKVVEFNYGEGDITFTADAPVTVKQTVLGSDWVFTQGYTNTITVGENVTFEIYDNASGLYVYYGPSLNIEGTVTGGQNWGCAYMFYSDHTVADSGTLSVGRVQLGFASLTVGDAEKATTRTDNHIDTNYLLIEEGTFTANNANIKAGAIHDSDNGGLRYGASDFVFSNSKVTANSLTLKHADSTVSVENSTLTANTVANGGSINVTGASDIKANVSGTGWMYMDSVTLDSDTDIKGGNVRFTNGTSTLDGAVIDANAFQVGIGAYMAADERETVADVVVNVTNNSYINGPDVDYNGWIGTGYYDTDAEKAAVMTDARYTLNVEDSVARFGYLHISNDGILNASGNADDMLSYAGVDYSFWGGRVIINGNAVFDDVDALVQITNISANNGSDVPGKLVVQNGAKYTSWFDSSSTIESFKISKNGIAEVTGENSIIDARHGTLIGADAKLDVSDKGLFKGNLITNNGTVTVNGGTLTANTVTNSGTVTVNGGTLTANTVANSSTFTVGGNSTVKVADFNGTLSVADGAVFSDDTAITVTDGSIVAEGSVTLKAGSITGAANFTASSVNFTGVELPTDQVITVYAGDTDFGKLAINGFNVAQNKIYADGVLYSVVTDDTAITVEKLEGVEYEPISFTVDSITQTAGTYSFVFGLTIAGGNGEYTTAVTAKDTITDEVVSGTYDDASRTFTFDGIAMTSPVTFTVNVADSYGAHTTVTVGKATHIADYTAPEVTDVAATVDGDKLALAWNGSDNFAVVGYTVNINGAEYSLVGADNNSFEYTAGVSGVYSYTVTAYDAAGNVFTTASADAELYVAMTSQGVTLTQVANEHAFIVDTPVEGGKGAYTYAYTVTDADGNAVDCTVVGNKITLNDNTVKGIIVNVAVTDEAGKTIEIGAESAVADYTAPEIAVSGNSSEWTNKSVTLNVAASDNFGDITVEYSFDNVSWNAVENGTLTVDENAKVYFKVTDAANNVAESTVDVANIDKSAPVLTVSADKLNAANVVTVTADVAENGSGLASVKYSFNGTDWFDYTDGIKVTSNGSIYFEAVDNVGNTSEAEFTVSNISNIDIRSNITDNGFSQIVAYDEARGAVGYIANDGTSTEWKGIWHWGEDAAASWKAIAVGNFGDTLNTKDGILLYNVRNNTFAAWTDLGSGDYGYKSLLYVESNFSVKCTANLDGDGIDDVLIFNEQGNFGTVLNATSYRDIWHAADDQPQTVELIGAGYFGAADGKDSLVVKDLADNTYELWHNNGDIRSEWAWGAETVADIDSDWSIAAIGDFQGDGIDDIVVWQKSTGYMYAWENGKADDTRWVGALEQDSWEVAAVGDYNGDGKEDLLLREMVSGWGGLGVWEGAYAGSWTDLNARIESDNNGSKFGIIA